MKSPSVELCGGVLEGQHQEGAMAWLGIRYARARRFEPPTLLNSLSGKIPCKAYGPRCPQNLSKSPQRSETKSPDFQEDCLNLNVWSPSEKTSELRPVMVWIHGGAFIGGGSNSFDGSEYAREHGIVVVSINYRLGFLGFLDLASALDDPSLPGNLGLRDQIAALQWIKQNIAAFGGDPDKVTVAGESAGSISISMLMACDQAQGLFGRAILQSGGPSLGFRKETSARLAKAFMSRLGDKVETLEDLQSIPVETILSAQCEVFSSEPEGLPVSPWWDGDLLPASLSQAQQAGTHPIPVLAGATREEIRFFELPPIPESLPMSWQRMEAVLTENFGPQPARELMSVYPPTTSGRRDLAGDMAFRMPTQNFAEKQSETQPVWFYRFDYQHPIAGACHLLDTAFLWPYRGLFALLCRGGPLSGKRKHLADRMKRHWADFVRDGQPGRDWPPYSPSNRSVKIFGLEDHIENDPDSERRTAWAMRDAQTQF